MAKKKRKRKKGGLFKKALKAGALLALVPMIPVMAGLIAATVTTNPAAAKALKKKLRKKKLKKLVKEFVDKVIKKKKNFEDLESSFDYETMKTIGAFQGDVEHLQMDARSLDQMVNDGLDASDSLESGLDGDHFVQAIADIVKMVFGFIKGLGKKKKSGEKLSEAEVEAVTESEAITEEKADAAIEAEKKKSGGSLGGLPMKQILMVVGGLVGLGVLYKVVAKK